MLRRRGVCNHEKVKVGKGSKQCFAGVTGTGSKYQHGTWGGSRRKVMRSGKVLCVYPCVCSCWIVGRQAAAGSACRCGVVKMPVPQRVVRHRQPPMFYPVQAKAGRWSRRAGSRMQASVILCLRAIGRCMVVAELGTPEPRSPARGECGRSGNRRRSSPVQMK